MSEEKNKKSEKQADKLPQHVLDGLERSLAQIKNGQTISWEEFRLKHFRKEDK